MRILKELAVGAETTEAGSEFQTRTTRHAKKWSLVLHLERGISRRKGCPLDDKLRDGVVVVVVVVVYLTTNQRHMGYLSSGNGHLAGRYSTP